MKKILRSILCLFAVISIAACSTPSTKKYEEKYLDEAVYNLLERINYSPAYIEMRVLKAHHISLSTTLVNYVKDFINKFEHELMLYNIEHLEEIIENFCGFSMLLTDQYDSYYIYEYYTPHYGDHLSTGDNEIIYNYNMNYAIKMPMYIVAKSIIFRELDELSSFSEQTYDNFLLNHRKAYAQGAYIYTTISNQKINKLIND